MSDIHKGLPQKSFTRPSGIYDVAVCRGSGLLMTASCTQGAIYLPFIEGTVPARYCDLHGSGNALQTTRPTVTSTRLNDVDSSFLDEIPRPQLPADLFPELLNTPTQQRQNQNNRNPRTPQSSNNNRNNNTNNGQAVIPDTAVRFDPREDDSDENDDDYLPPWDQLD
jgi:penicillin-binding protein 1A